MSEFKIDIDPEGLKLIPKYMDFLRYMLNVLEKLPRVEKFSMGNDFKSVMYKEVEEIMYIGKVAKESRLDYINRADAMVAIQKEYLRVMYDRRMIDEKVFRIAISKIAEVGKMIGGLIKIYGTHYKKHV